MSVEVDIKLLDNRARYTVGDTVTGEATVILPDDVPLATNVTLSFHCVGEVKWVEYPGTPYYLNGYIYYDQYDYHHEEAPIDESSKCLH